MIDFFISLLTALEVIAALLIIVVILLQRSKSGGGLGAIGGAATDEVFGSSYGNVLSKSTVILASFFLINTLVLAVLQGNAVKSQSVSIVESLEDSEGTTIQGAPDDKPTITGSDKESEATSTSKEEKDSQDQVDTVGQGENSTSISDGIQIDAENTETNLPKETSQEKDESLPKAVPLKDQVKPLTNESDPSELNPDDSSE